MFPLSDQSLLVESPVSSTVSPGVFSLDPSFSESPLSAPISSITSIVGRKGGTGRKKGKMKKKKDPNEPWKPVSAYTLFLKDSRAAIKGQNPKATFGEVSKIVASMWDSLGEEQTQVRGGNSFNFNCAHSCLTLPISPAVEGVIYIHCEHMTVPPTVCSSSGSMDKDVLTWKYKRCL